MRLAAGLMFALGLAAGAPVGLATGRPAMAAAVGSHDPMVVVGVVATLSGPGSLAGQDLTDGFTLALRHLGGRFANQEVRIVLLDDRGSPDTGLVAARRLIDREKVDVVLTAVSRASFAAIIRPLIQSRVFVLNLDGAPSAQVGPECSQWAFELGTPPEAIHEAAGQHLAAEHARRVILVGPDVPATGDAALSLKRTFPGELTVITPRHGSATFDAELARIREVRPDAVYTTLTGGMAVGFVRAFEAAGLKADIPLVAPWTAVERPLLPAMADAALDIVNLAPWSPDLDSPQNKRLVNDFESEYGRPATSWSAQGYDAALLLDSALKATQGRTSDPDALRGALRRAEFFSVRGGFRFNTNHQPVVNVYLRKVSRDAKGRLTQELRGPVLKDWRDSRGSLCPMRWVDEAPPGLPAKAGAAGVPARPGTPGQPPKPGAPAPSPAPAARVPPR